MRRKVKRHANFTSQDVAMTHQVQVRGDAEVEAVFGSSGMRAEQRDAMIAIMKDEEMAESSSSESSEDDDEEDESNRVDEKKLKLEGNRAGRVTSSLRNGGMDSKAAAQASRKAGGGLFQGGPSFW